MKLELDFKQLGKFHVELDNISDVDYKAISAYFIPLLNQTGMKAREAIAEAFEFAVSRCPNANPSDIWHHVLYRIYLDTKTGTNPNQSWVRASGDALESFICHKYNPFLLNHKIRLVPLFSKDAKKDALVRMGLVDRLGSSKVDVLIEREGFGVSPGLEGYGIIGGLHVKTSLAERVSDDIPASKIMMGADLLSILWTLDIKSFPPPHGDLVNRGELGTPATPSDKRKYIEAHGDFSACFSYNHRSVPSGKVTVSNKRIYVVNSIASLDPFVKFLVSSAEKL